MACSHTDRFLNKVNQARLGLEDGVPYLNSGVLMMDLALLRGTLRLDDIRDYAERYKKRLILPDQDILTALFGSRALVLDSRIYNMTDRLYIQCQCSAAPAERLSIDWVRQNTVVVHYLGKPKPWQKGYVGPLGVFYKEELARAGG